jgi:hypothetical protein
MFHPFHFSPFYFGPFLVVSSTSLKIQYPFLYREHVNLIQLFTSFFYPPPTVSALPLVWPIFHFCPSLFRSLFIIVGFLPWYYTHTYIVLKSMYPSYNILSLLFFHYPMLFNSFQCVSLCHIPTQM